jgi:hypothetical protein
MAYFNINNFLENIAGKNGFQRTTQFRCKIPVAAIGAAGGVLHQRDRKPLGSYFTRTYSEAAKWLEEGLICEQTRTPSRSFEATSLGIFGLDEKYPVFTTYTDHECTFMTPLVKRGGKHHNDVANIFHEWQSGVQSRTDPLGNDADMVMKFPDEYRLTQGMQLDQFSTYNPKRRGGLFGVNVSAQGNVRDVIRDVNRVSSWFDRDPIPTEWSSRKNPDEDDSVPSLSYKFFNVFPRTVESAALAWNGEAEIQKVTVSFTYSYWSAVDWRQDGDDTPAGGSLDKIANIASGIRQIF